MFGNCDLKLSPYRLWLDIVEIDTKKVELSALGAGFSLAPKKHGHKVLATTSGLSAAARS